MKIKLIFLILVINILIKKNYGIREKRYLIFPRGNPTRHQVKFYLFNNN